MLGLQNDQRKGDRTPGAVTFLQVMDQRRKRQEREKPNILVHCPLLSWFPNVVWDSARLIYIQYVSKYCMLMMVNSPAHESSTEIIIMDSHNPLCIQGDAGINQTSGLHFGHSGFSSFLFLRVHVCSIPTLSAKLNNIRICVILQSLGLKFLVFS